MKSGCFEIPVKHQDTFAICRQYPGDIRERHRSSSAALVRIESDDLAGWRRLFHGLLHGVHTQVIVLATALGSLLMLGRGIVFGTSFTSSTFPCIWALILNSTSPSTSRNSWTVRMESR